VDGLFNVDGPALLKLEEVMSSLEGIKINIIREQMMILEMNNENMKGLMGKNLKQ
jgi:hypothetical protein